MLQRSWVIAWAIVMFVLVFAGLMTANSMAQPTTVSGFTCYGIQQKCTNHDVCMEWAAGAAGTGNSLGKESVTNLTYWKPCTLQSRYKILNPTCIFDRQLYDMSGGTIGYDFCSKTFDNGVLHFHDDFEHWPTSTGYSNNGMASGIWYNVHNGEWS